MDFEYLEHIKGSPYVKEGAMGYLKSKADQAKAHAAQGLGGINAITGYEIQDKNFTAVRSLWNSFLKSLTSLMEDWNDEVAHMIDSPQVKSQLGEKELALKEALDGLFNSLRSQAPRGIGSVTPRTERPWDTVQDRYPNPSQSGTYPQQSPPSPTLKSLVKKKKETPATRADAAIQAKKQQGFDPSIEEGMWTRDLGLNKALWSRNPGRILNGYKDEVVKLFTNFLKQVKNVTGLSYQQLIPLVAKIQVGPFRASVKSVIDKVQALVNTPDTDQPQDQAKPQAGQPQTQQPQQPQQPQQGASAQPSQTQAGGGQGGTGSGGISPNDFPWVVLKAIEIIIDAVKSDVGHSGKFFDMKGANQYVDLPTSYPTDMQLTKPSNIKEIHSDPRGSKEDVPEKPEQGTKEEEPEYKGEFLYNFHSKFNKYPGTHFAIEVKPVTVSPYLDKGPYAKDKDLEGPIAKPKVEVWWNCEDTKNQIYVLEELNGKKSKPTLIMQFFDQEVDSQAGATTAGHTNVFSTEKLLQSADPMGGPDKSKMIKPVIEQVKALEPALIRALMATTTRKSMEFKKKSKRAFPIKFDDKGNIKFFNKESGAEDTLDPAGVKEALSGPDSQAWYDSLDHYGYFEQFPEMKPKTEKDYPAYGDAVDKVVQSGVEQKTAESSVAKAWLKMRPYKIDNLDSITADQLFAVAKGEASPEEAIGPNLADGKLGVEALGFKGEEVTKYLAAAWNELKKTKPENTITKEDLVKQVLKKKPEEPEKPTTPTPPAGGGTPPADVSKSAGGEPPKSPVSGTPSTSAGGEPPKSPVSGPPAASGTPETKPETPATPGAPATPEPKAKKPKEKKQLHIWKTKDGTLAWSNFQGDQGALNKDTIAKLKKKYPQAYQSALDQAKANKFADPFPGGETETVPKKPLKELIELGDGLDLTNERVNPFQLANFL
jgi:hypothetical protein